MTFRSPSHRQGGLHRVRTMIVERLKEQDDVPAWDDPDDVNLFG